MTTDEDGLPLGFVGSHGNPRAHAVILAHRLGLPWQHVNSIASAMTRLAEWYCPGDDIDVCGDVWGHTETCFARCGSPIEELFLAHLMMANDPSAITTNWCEYPPPEDWQFAYLGTEIGHFSTKERGQGIFVYQQMPLGKFRIDFGFAQPGTCIRVAVELDGHEFHERNKKQAERDKSRDRAMQEEGWVVLRFTGSEVWRNPAGCVEQVLRFFRKETQITQEEVDH